MVVLQFLPVVLLGIYFTTYEVGIFSAPYRIVTTFTTVGALLTTASFPVLSDLYVKDKKQISVVTWRLILTMMALGVPLAIILSIYAKAIIALLLGENYKESISVFAILIWLLPLRFLRNIYGKVLLAVNLHRHNVILVFSSVVFFLILAFSFRDNLNEYMPMILLASEGLLALMFAATVKLFSRRTQ